MLHSPDFQSLMREATRLTRSGDLDAAARVIRQAMQARAPAAATHTPDIVIDVEAREVPDGEPPAPTEPPATRADRPSPDGPGAFVAGHHRAAGLERDYRLFIPPGTPDGPRPLVVMLHGCTQDPDDFARGTGMNALARESGWLVLYPAQSRKANQQGCWNWFKHSHQQRGRGEPALLASMVRQVVAEHDGDPSRTYVAGLSAGGAMALILAEAYPELFAAVGVHSGLPTGAAGDLPSALQAMQHGATAASRPGVVPAIVFHGDRDTTVHPRNGERVAEAHAGHTRTQVEHGRAPGGHPYTRTVHLDAGGQARVEHWVLHGVGHAWSGGQRGGSHVDPRGPDASREMLRFFATHRRGGRAPL